MYQPIDQVKTGIKLKMMLAYAKTIKLELATDKVEIALVLDF